MQFNVSQVGQYHLDAGSDVCQDYNYILEVNKDVTIAVVSDGVGSQQYSDEASKIAAVKCAEYFKEWYGKEERENEVLLKRAFYSALLEVEDHFRNKGIPMNDCTLCAVVFMPDKVICGQSGDSGAIGLRDDGNYVLLSEKQNDDEGRVYVLSFTDKWVFKTFEGRFASILLATDGFYDFMFPSFMTMSPDYDPNDKLTVFDYELAAKYMDIREINKNKREITEDEFVNYSLDLVNSIPRKGSKWDAIDDDLTVLTIIKNDIVPGQSDKFVKTIDRNTFKREATIKRYKEIYPEKELIISDYGVYPVAQVALKRSEVDSDYCVKIIVGNRLCLCHPLASLDPDKDINALVTAEDVPDLCLKPFDIIYDDNYVSLIVKTESVMTPLSTFLPARKRTDEELRTILDGFVKAVKLLHDTAYEPELYDTDHVFTDINGHVCIDSSLSPYALKRSIHTQDLNNISKIKSIINVMSEIWVKSKRRNNNDSTESVRTIPENVELDVKSIFGFTNSLDDNAQSGEDCIENNSTDSNLNDETIELDDVKVQGTEKQQESTIEDSKQDESDSSDSNQTTSQHAVTEDNQSDSTVKSTKTTQIASDEVDENENVSESSAEQETKADERMKGGFISWVKTGLSSFKNKTKSAEDQNDDQSCNNQNVQLEEKTDANVQKTQDVGLDVTKQKDSNNTSDNNNNMISESKSVNSNRPQKTDTKIRYNNSEKKKNKRK